MNKLFTQVREDTCIYCGRDKAIELFDKNNNPIKFSFILDTNRVFLLNIRDIRYGRCTCCGKVFMLDWSNSEKRIPKPLMNINFKNYIQQYSKSKIV